MFNRLFGDGGIGLQPKVRQTGISRLIDQIGSVGKGLLGCSVHLAPNQKGRDIGAHFPTQFLRLGQEFPTVGHGLSVILFNPDENRHH